MTARLPLLWLATATLFVCADKQSLLLNVKSADTRKLAEDRRESVTKRFLRVDEPPKERDEERANPRVVAVEGSASWVGKWLTSPVQNMWTSLVSRDSEAFKALKRKLMPILMKLHVVETPEERNKKVRQLLRRYGVRKVVQALVYPRPTPALRENAATMLETLMEACLSKGYSPTIFFEILKIRCDSTVLLYPMMDVVEGFLKIFNTKHKQQRTLFKILAPYVPESSLAESIGLAKILNPLKERALGVEKSLVAKWKLERLHPITLLQRLGMDQSVAALSNPSLGTLMMYIHEYNAINPNNKFSMLAWLTQKYKVSILAEELVLATNFPGTKNAAKELHDELLRAWLTEGKSVDEVFKLLELSNHGDFVRYSPALQTLEKYIELFNKDKPEKDRKLLLRVVINGLEDGPLALLLTGSKWLSIPNMDLAKCLRFLFRRWDNANIDPSSVKSKYFGKSYPYFFPKIDKIVSKYETFRADGRLKRNI